MAERPQPSVSNQREAEHLVDGIIDVMGKLHEVVTRETDLLKAYRLRDAAALGEAKTVASHHYVQALGLLKANAIALARWAPKAVARLKVAQGRLGDSLNVNMAVLATTRSVSEGIIRTLATEVAAPTTLSTYGAGGRATPPSRSSSATPLMVSRTM